MSLPLNNIRRYSTWLLKKIGGIFLILFITLLLLELSYRYQWIDFYTTEFQLLNQKYSAKKSKKTVLVFGDSFTASENNYVDFLNDSLSDIKFINAAIPGTGIEEVSYILNNRLKQTKPAAVIIQIYPGNDLLDIQKPINWTTLPFSRNLYWSASEYFHCLRYLNYKAGQFKSVIGQSTEVERLKNDKSFSPEHFTKRELLYLKADPSYLEKCITTNSNYHSLFIKYQQKLSATLATLNENKIPTYILIIPTAIQVNPFYQNNYLQVGANLTNSTTLLMPDFSFYTNLKFMTTNSTDFINLLPHFQLADTTGHRLYYENDIHLNKEGQLKVTEILLPYFQQTQPHLF